MSNSYYIYLCGSDKVEINSLVTIVDTINNNSEMTIELVGLITPFLSDTPISLTSRNDKNFKGYCQRIKMYKNGGRDMTEFVFLLKEEAYFNIDVTENKQLEIVNAIKL